MKELHCSPNTVRNIIKKGMTPLYHGKVLRFKARTAWKTYQEKRSHCCRNYAALEKRRFLRYVEEHYFEGKTVKDIQALMDIKESTLRYHNRNIYGKLGVHSMKQLLQFAVYANEQRSTE